MKKNKKQDGVKRFVTDTEMEFRKEVLETLELLERKVGASFTPSIKELKQKFLLLGASNTTKSKNCEHTFYRIGEILLRSGEANVWLKCSKCGEETDKTVDASPY